VTIATNMAGRGTDIKLGEGVAELGGLYVIGTERHQSRRIDRQLRGRSGRQGDPGRSRFYVSLEDDLMRLFGNAGAVIKMLESTFEEGQPIQHPLLTRTLETAQRRFEENHYMIRKRLLQFDDVLNRQRQVIYEIRNEAIHAEDPSGLIFDLVEEEVGTRIYEGGVFNEGKFDAAVYEQFAVGLRALLPLPFDISDADKADSDSLRKAIMAQVREAFARAGRDVPMDVVHDYQRFIVLRAIDRHWQIHLTTMDDLRDSVGLRSYGQRDPLNEYKTEAFTYFQSMMGELRSELAQGLLRIISEMPALGQLVANRTRVRMTGPSEATVSLGSAVQSTSTSSGAEAEPKLNFKRTEPKVGRNDPCPCGSGKKYKNCCGRNK
jgi:preprotein translocase subunit SecA